MLGFIPGGASEKSRQLVEAIRRKRESLIRVQKSGHLAALFHHGFVQVLKLFRDNSSLLRLFPTFVHHI
jgi:hypothetical protein